MTRIALLTCAGLPSLYGDEQELPARFAAAGVTAEPAVWSDESIEWTRFDALVIRSTWDYFERIDEFRAWLQKIERGGPPLHNPPSLVRWNLDKRYLAELESRGIRIVPTRFVDAHAKADLEAIVSERGWPEAIVKPSVSGGAARTHRFRAAEAGATQAALDEILQRGAALVQPFLDEIVRIGEYSLFYFGGAFSHAVLKMPAKGDFRVQAQHGGTHRPIDPPGHVRAATDAVLHALPIEPLYARIDGITRDGRFELMEVEVIEPYLFFPGSGDAAIARYVDAVTACVRGRS